MIHACYRLRGGVRRLGLGLEVVINVISNLDLFIIFVGNMRFFTTGKL